MMEQAVETKELLKNGEHGKEVGGEIHAAGKRKREDTIPAAPKIVRISPQSRLHERDDEATIHAGDGTGNEPQLSEIYHANEQREIYCISDRGGKFKGCLRVKIDVSDILMGSVDMSLYVGEGVRNLRVKVKK